MSTVAVPSRPATELYGGALASGRDAARRVLRGEIGWLLFCVLLVAPTLLLATGTVPAWLSAATRTHLARELTGFAALAVVIAQLALSAGKRLLRGAAIRRWLRLHRLGGPLLLLLVVIHTGSRAGHYANALLWSCLCLMLAMAQGGHVLKAWTRLRAEGGTANARVLDGLVNAPDGWIHLAGYQAHVLLALLVTLLLAVHVICVYWF